jgi:alcohol dehydrogenase class IV
MRFDFSTANRIVFGSGTIHEVAGIVGSFGTRALLVCGIFNDAFRQLSDQVAAAGITSVVYQVEQEPTIEMIQAGVEIAKFQACQFVISFGGGSAIDTGKAIAALISNPGDVLDYLEVIGKGKALRESSIPHIAIPTTAGTGAEVTRNAVLSSKEHRVKVSLRSPSMLPVVAIVDPDLTIPLPRAVTASTGLDALTQLIEPFVSSAANPLTDAICVEGILRAARSLRKAYQDGNDSDARRDMSLASLFGGMALANAKLGAVHGFAGPLGGEIAAPHGAICARLLPIVMDVNIRALSQREPHHPALQKYQEIARLLTGRLEAQRNDGIEWVNNLCDDLDIQGLGFYGLTKENFPKMVDDAAKASSMKGNPIQLSKLELIEILHHAL